MKHHLTVKIEKRFKKQLSERFNPRYARNRGLMGRREIIRTCVLCDEFKTTDYGILYCGKCPLEKFVGGCLAWLEEVGGLQFGRIVGITTNCIYWRKEDNKRAIELLKKLREKAKKYIIWVENTK